MHLHAWAYCQSNSGARRALRPGWCSRPVASPNVQMAKGLSQDVARPWRLEFPGRHDPTSACLQCVDHLRRSDEQPSKVAELRFPVITRRVAVRIVHLDRLENVGGACFVLDGHGRRDRFGVVVPHLDHRWRRCG